MEQKKRINIYKATGKLGKLVKKSCGYVITVGATYLFCKIKDKK